MAADGAFEKLSVLLEAKTRKYVRDMRRSADATDDWAEETEKAGAKAELAARKSEGAFSRVVRAIRKTRGEAKKPATFTVAAEERGFSGPKGILTRIRSVRKEAAKGADVEVRFRQTGMAGVLAASKAVDKALDRVDGRTAEVNFRGDERGVRSMGDAFGELSSGIRNTGTVLRASAIPLGIAAIGAGIPTVTALASSVAGLALNLGKGAAGFVAIGGAAGGVGYAGLALYAKGISSVVSASREAYEATNEHRMELLEKRRQEILGTRASQAFNAEIDRQLVGLTRLQAAVGSRVFPYFTEEMRAWTPVLRENRGEILDTAEAVAETATGFARWFRLADQGKMLDRTIGFLNTSTEQGATILSNLGIAGVSAFQPIIPLALKLQEETRVLTNETQKWVQSAEGQARLGQIYRDLDAEMRRTGQTALDLGTGVVNTLDAIDRAGVSDQASAGLATMARRFAETTARGTDSRRTLDGFMGDVRELMPFVGSLGTEVWTQFTRISRSLISARQEGSRLTILQTTLKGIENSAEPVADLLISTTRSLGPELGPLIHNFAELGETFAGSSGPLVTYVRTLNRGLEVVNDLPAPVKHAAANLLAMKLILGTLGFGAVLGPAASFASNLFLVNRGAKAVGASVGAASGKAGLGAMAGRLALGGPVLVGLAALAAAFGVAYAKSDKFRAKVNGVASDLSSWSQDKFAQANAALNDVFDVDQEKAAENARQAGDATASAYAQTVKNRLGGSGEGSTGYEIGYGLVAALIGGAKARGGQANWMSILGLSASGEGTDVFEPVYKQMDAAGRGARQRFVEELKKTNWGSALLSQAKQAEEKAKQQGGVAGTQYGTSYENSVVARLRKAQQAMNQQFQKGNKVWVSGLGWVERETDKKMGQIKQHVTEDTRDAGRAGASAGQDFRTKWGTDMRQAQSSTKASTNQIVQAVGGKTKEAASQGSKNSEVLKKNVSADMGATEKNAELRMEAMKGHVSSNSNAAKTSATNAANTTKTNVTRSYGQIDSSAKTNWDSIYDTTRTKSWDAENSSTNAWSKLAGFVSGVLSRLGIGSGSGSGSPGSPPKNSGQQRQTNFARGGIWDGPAKYARGGMWIADDGGVGDGKTIGAITNEAGDREAIVNLDRRTPESQHAFRAAERSPNARRGRGREEEHDRAHRSGRIRPFASGGLWEPGVAGVNDEIESKFGVQGSTYAGHGRNANSRTSVDWVMPSGWGVDATGSAKAVGDRIASHMQQNWDRFSTEYLIWYTQMKESASGGWFPYTGGGGYAPVGPGSSPSAKHTDHFHYSATEPWGGSESLTGGGPAAGPVPNPLQAAFELAWKPVQALADSVFGPMKAASFWLSRAGGGLGSQSVTSIHDWIDAKIPDTILGQSGSSGTPYSGGGKLDDWLMAGLKLGNAFPATSGNVAKLRSLAMEESGGDPNAVNEGYTAGGGHPSGLLQMLPDTFAAYDVPGHSNIFDPVDNTAASTRYQKDRYGYLKSHAPYAKGGIANAGRPGRVTLTGTVKNAFLRVADTLAAFAGKGPAGGVAIGDAGGVGTGREIVAITNEAGPEGVMPLRKWTPGGQQAFDAGKRLYGDRKHRRGPEWMAEGGVTQLGWNLIGGDGHLGIGGPAASDAINAANEFWPGANVGPGSDVNAYYNQGAAGGGMTSSSGGMWVAATRAGTELGQTLWGHEVFHAFGGGHGDGIMSPVVSAGMRPTPAQQEFVDQQFGSSGVPVEGGGPHPSGGSSRSPQSGGGSSSSVSITQTGGGPQRTIQRQGTSTGSSGSSGMRTSVEGWGRGAGRAGSRLDLGGLKRDIAAEVREALEGAGITIRRFDREADEQLKEGQEAGADRWGNGPKGLAAHRGNATKAKRKVGNHG